MLCIFLTGVYIRLRAYTPTHPTHLMPLLFVYPLDELLQISCSIGLLGPMSAESYDRPVDACRSYGRTQSENLRHSIEEPILLFACCRNLNQYEASVTGTGCNDSVQIHRTGEHSVDLFSRLRTVRIGLQY